MVLPFSRRQSECVRDESIERRPLANLALAAVRRSRGQIVALADIVRGDTGVQSAIIIEQAGVEPIVREITSKARLASGVLQLLVPNIDRSYIARQVVAVERECKRPEVATTKDLGIERVD